MVILNALYQIVKYRKRKALKLALVNQFKSLEYLKEYQEIKFIELIEHSKKNVPYYGSILKDVDIKSVGDLQKIPFLTKKIIKSNYIQLQATNFPRSRFKTNATSGSTGENLYFYSDKADNFSSSCRLRGDMMTGYNFGERNISIWGARQDISPSRAKRFMNRYIKESIVLSCFNMSDEDMHKYQKTINKFKPSLIIGYPSGLFLFSEFLSKNKLSIHSPKGLISGGETLYDFQRQLIQEVFQAKILNRYGCREVDHIANECEVQNGLHISMDHVIVEVINENGEPCKSGEIGEMVITDLDNYAFPFLRYKIGDIGVLSDSTCQCQRSFPLLEKVEGRVFDIIIGTNNNRVTGTYWTLLKYQVNGIEKFQVVQNQKNELNIKIVPNNLFNQSEEEKLKSLIKEQLGMDMQIHIERVGDIPLTKSGKYRWVISQISDFVVK